MTKSRSEELFDYAMKFATPFSTPLGHAWAIIPVGGGRYRGLPISSLNFREWLSQGYLAEFGLYPGLHAQNSAIQMFAAQARSNSFPARDVFARVGSRGPVNDPHSVLIHLANHDLELLEITAGGHHILGAESWHFMATRATAPLPRPAHSAKPLVEQLQHVLGLSGPSLTRALVWLFAALRPTGPYPPLVITGPHGCGKSVLARSLRTLIDPSEYPISDLPSARQELYTIALHNHVLAFDDVMQIPREMEAALSRLSTGTGFGICHRNMFDEPDVVVMSRPFIIVAPELPRAFTNRAIHVRLENIEIGNLQTEKEFERRITAGAPFILGSLANAVSCALANTTAADAAPVSRFADVHQWTIAAAPALGLSAGQISRALSANHLVDALSALLAQSREWEGTATELLDALASEGYPCIAKNARSLSEQLNGTMLELFGIYQQKKHTGEERRIRLTQNPEFCVSEGLA